MDLRPTNCRFRLQAEGKAFPKSACEACGKTIETGLGTYCEYGTGSVSSEPTEKPASDLFVGPFKKDQRLLLEPAQNGGWILKAFYGEGRRNDVLGAYSNSHDMLTALASSLTPEKPL